MGLLRKRKPAAPPPIGDGYSVLDSQLTIVGDISTDGTLRIEGKLEGSVRRAGVVILGVGASVQGSIAASEVVVGGSVSGDIHAAQRVELQPTAVVTGDIEAGAILIQEGGVLRGRLSVRAAGTEPTPIQAPQPAQQPARIPSITPSLRLAATSSATGS